MNPPTSKMRPHQYAALLACFLLCMATGRILGLVTHTPLLGYANNYDMIRLQACHQIWPADKAINITSGTPSAPLRRYTLDKHVETTCFPSSELLFTATAIELGKLKNLVTGESLISMKTIGLTKAIFLIITAALAGLYFYRQAMYSALLANSLIMLLVLSDPAITLYLNTFYTEFSAVYFFYLSLIGAAILADHHCKPSASVLLAIGIAGLSFSKPQHLPLAVLLALCLSVYAILRRRWNIAPVLLLCALLPCILQTTTHFSTRNDSMRQADNINLVGSMLGVAGNPPDILSSLSLPPACSALAGKNAYSQAATVLTSCPSIKNLTKPAIVLALIQNPSTLATLSSRALQEYRNWIFDLYGQVEHARYEQASSYQRTIHNLVRQAPFWLVCLVVSACNIIPLMLSLVAARRHGVVSAYCTALLLIAALQWMVLATAIAEGGLVGLGKSLHLYWSLILAQSGLLVLFPLLPRFTSGNPGNTLFTSLNQNTFRERHERHTNRT